MIEMDNNLKERMAVLTEKYHLEKTDEDNFKINVNGFEITFHNFGNLHFINIIQMYQFKQQEIINLTCTLYDILANQKSEFKYITEKTVKEVEPILIDIFYKIYNIFENMFQSNNWDSKETLETYFNYKATELLLVYLDILDCIYIAIIISLKDLWKKFETVNPEKAEVVKNISDSLFGITYDYNNIDLNNIKTIGNA